MRKAILVLAVLTWAGCSSRHERALTIDWPARADEPSNLGFEQGIAGWSYSNYDYAGGADSTTKNSGKSSAFIRSAGPQDDSGRLFQEIRATKFRGKPLMMSAYLKVGPLEATDRDHGPSTNWKDPPPGASLFMVLYGSGRLLGQARSSLITETNAWEQHVITLDVPQHCEGISFGVRLRGRGVVWIDDVELDTLP
jgi:hypothetical protein